VCGGGAHAAIDADRSPGRADTACELLLLLQLLLLQLLLLLLLLLHH
jgi:hypothetical protein